MALDLIIILQQIEKSDCGIPQSQVGINNPQTRSESTY